MAKCLRVILGDQLSHQLEIVKEAEISQDVFLFCEVYEETKYVWHHPKKIALIFSAMRHFAQELVALGHKVEYVKLDDLENSKSFVGEITRAAKKFSPEKILVTEPSEFRVKQAFLELQKTTLSNLEILLDTRFLCSIAEFAKWSKDRKELRLEYFYREMRKKYKILLDKNQKPVGGKWNFDAENRKAAPENLVEPKRIWHKKDQITREVLDLVKREFPDHFGDLEPFYFAVNRQQALMEAKDFIENILENFGDYQDAMLKGKAFVNHSLLSSYINIGLLLPLEICQMAEAAYEKGLASLNSVEGFIRQIMGWREYVRGIYFTKMPQYGEMNFFEAKQNLPEFFWGKKTQMSCIGEVVKQTKEHAYSHHIQRLMITGNFALIAGIEPKQVHEWYLAVYADAFEAYELPNTIGMALHADGGVMASKPYAASGNYISKMSNFCDSCAYNYKETFGDKACPFNVLYWDFLDRNRNKLRKNMRLTFAYNTLEKFSDEKLSSLRNQAAKTLEKMSKSQL